ncbi:MAG TPA: hypothetical protein VN877_08340 [Opitutaceae bacterium]|nr:hypothetical protein [Opitutaceae bacterium]
MNAKTLLIVPAALAIASTAHAWSHWGFGLNLNLPLYYPTPGYARTVVYQAPPSSVAEQVTPAPGPGYVWLSGHWSFYGSRWVWVAGHWEMPPSPSATWVAGHWVQGSSGWVWVDGAWNVGSPPSAPGSPPSPPSVPAPVAAVPVPSTPAPAAVEVQEGMVVADEPPAPIVEYVPACPSPEFVWVGGFWGWNGGWYWNAGRYAHAPFRGAAWVSGGWARGGRGWAWHGGRWR